MSSVSTASGTCASSRYLGSSSGQSLVSTRPGDGSTFYQIYEMLGHGTGHEVRPMIAERQQGIVAAVALAKGGVDDMAEWVLGPCGATASVSCALFRPDVSAPLRATASAGRVCSGSDPLMHSLVVLTKLHRKRVSRAQAPAFKLNFKLNRAAVIEGVPCLPQVALCPSVVTAAPYACRLNSQ